ncbi:LacI family DNA-binding transcriptional regulator [Amphibacillus sp. Q70]|uniref:LacI family DNA-binding transcriptional regulator n=1 Tax=Amphibacillus sp. Q70 TaxID=3453416 RepID=UPI003F82A277
MAKKVTLKQIADYIGVSIFVVSRALSGKPGVKKETKERIFQVASQLGYFTQNGKDIRTEKKTENDRDLKDRKSVLIIMPDIRNQLRDSIYWGTIINGISDSLDKLNLRMVILTESNTDDLQEVVNPAGFIGMIGVGKVSTKLILEIQSHDLPVVLIDHEEKLYPTDSVFANNFDSSYYLTNHLIGIGHRNIQFYGNIQYSRSFQDRWLGFRTAIEEEDIELSEDSLTLLQGKTIDDMFLEIKEWLAARIDNNNVPTAICCANDSIALHLYRVCKELDLKIPDDISITGFDNIEDSYLLTPTLTTIDVPKEELGRRAVRALLTRNELKNVPTEKIILSGEMLLRDSVKALK